MVLVVTTIAFVLVGNLMRAGTGRKMLAVRSNERAAASIGIGVAGIKLSAFALASFLAGLGGALIGYSRGQLSPESFGVFVGLTFLAVAYLGGITSASGAFVAGALAALGIVFVIMDRLLELGSYYALFSGLSLLLTVVLNPLGIAGKTRADFDEFRRKRALKKGLAAPQVGVHEEAIVDEADVESVAEELAPAATAVRSARRSATSCCAPSASPSPTAGLRAVDDVDIDVREGEIVGLIGPNGAGKTSFIDAITGFAPCTGEVFLGDQELTDEPAHQRARAGLVRTWQSVELFDDLSAQSNVRVGRRHRQGRAGSCCKDTVRPNPPASQAVRDAMALMALDRRRRPQAVGALAGRQKTLGVARSLALRPRGAAPRRAGRRSRHGGEPRVRRAPPADRRHRRRLPPHRPRHAPRPRRVRPHLRDRVRSARSPPADPRGAQGPGGGGRLPRLRAPRPRVRDRDGGAMSADTAPVETGASTGQRPDRDQRTSSPATATCPVVRGLDISVREGEVVCILGANGAGKTTTLLTIAGVLPPLAGTVEVMGQPVGSKAKIHEVARRGLAIVPEGRGLFYKLTVAENLRLRQHRQSTVDDRRRRAVLPGAGQADGPAGRPAVRRRAADAGPRRRARSPIRRS